MIGPKFKDGDSVKLNESASTKWPLGAGRIFIARRPQFAAFDTSHNYDLEYLDESGNIRIYDRLHDHWLEAAGDTIVNSDLKCKCDIMKLMIGGCSCGGI